MPEIFKTSYSIPPLSLSVILSSCTPETFKLMLYSELTIFLARKKIIKSYQSQVLYFVSNHKTLTQILILKWVALFIIKIFKRKFNT